MRLGFVRAVIVEFICLGFRQKLNKIHIRIENHALGVEPLHSHDSAFRAGVNLTRRHAPVTLKRSLNADSKVSPIGGGEPLTGKAKLKINSTAESTYMCIVGINTSLEPIFASIQVCRDEKGKNELGFFDITEGFYLDPLELPTIVQDLKSKAGPILIPVDLHVVDSGKFDVKNGSTKIKGELVATVFDITAPFGDLQDLISISNAKASLAVEGP